MISGIKRNKQLPAQCTLGIESNLQRYREASAATARLCDFSRE